MIEVIITDDHHIIRAGVSLIVNEQDDMKVIDEAKNGNEAIEKALNLNPDIVIMDVNMPAKNGIEATKEIVAKNNHIKVLVLTTNNEDNLANLAFEAGASGFLLKSHSEIDLVEAIRSVNAGALYVK